MSELFSIEVLPAYAPYWCEATDTNTVYHSKFIATIDTPDGMVQQTWGKGYISRVTPGMYMVMPDSDYHNIMYFTDLYDAENYQDCCNGQVVVVAE